MKYISKLKFSRSQWIGVAILASSMAMGVAATVTLPNTFTAGTSAVAAEVNANFTALRDAFNALHTTGGVVQAAAHVTGGVTPSITRSFTNLAGSPAITVTRTAAGTYEVDFGANISTRFYNVVQGNAASGVPAGGSADVTPRASNVNALFIRTFDLAGAAVDTNFYVQVF